MFYISNLEKGYTARVDPSTQAAHQTLVRQMNWLDRNMETLLQQAPAPTVRFIAHSNRATDNTAAHTPQQPVKHYIDATAEPITNVSIPKSAEATSSKPIVNHYAYNPVKKNATTASSSGSSSSSTSKPAVEVNSKPSATESSTKKKEPAQHHFTFAETKTAEKKRKQELRQLQTRFCDSFKTMR
jgi:hypothetical protein